MHLTPKGPSGYGAELQTDSTPITKLSKAPDAAWEFQKFVTSQDAGLMLARASFLPGARPDVWGHPELLRDETHRPFVAVMQTAPPVGRPANLRLLEFQTEINAALTPVFRGERTVTDGIADAARRGQLVFDKPAPGKS